MIVTVFKNLYNSKDVPFHVPLEKIIKRIQQGTSKELIEKIRIEKDRNIQNKLKNQLPCILFNGVFSQRNSNSCTEHSGFMVVDFDKYENEKIMLENLELLKQNKHFILLFISPSGNGIKGVLKVSKELDKITHPKVFKQFKEEFNLPYFDIANSNIDRVCYESYDPNIYINFDAELYNPIIEEKGFHIKEKCPTLILTDEDKIINFIMNFKFKNSFINGQRNNYILDIAGFFCEYGINQNTAENYILNNIVTGDFLISEAKNTIKSAYKIRTFGCKYFEDYQKIDKIKIDLKNGKKSVIEKYKISEDTFNEIKEIEEVEDFWFFNDKNKPQIDLLKYKLFLERNGFKKYFPNDSQKPTWLFIKSNKVTETSVEKIKDFVLNYLIEKKEIDIWKYVAGYQNLFSENMLQMIDTIDLLMLKDTKEKSYICYENGILEVTKNDKKLIDYIDINGYVFESQIIKRNFKIIDDFKNEYQYFINNIGNKEPFAIECVIGYLLSNYKNKMNNRCIILNDEVISENPEGGTGKGLFIQGIKQIRKVSILDGKSFDDKKSFPYQTVNPETNVLVFDDVKKNFDFESKFSLVTEGMTLERKNKDAISLSVEDSPKMVMSTNYAIKGEGNSHDRRRFELEFAQYYGRNLTPYDEFGKQLFDDWNEDDFLKFDNYMIWCLQSYLSNGLVKQNAKNLKIRKFIAETSLEFLEWANDFDNLPLNIRNDKSHYFNKFVEEYQDFKKFLTRKKFNIWVQKFCVFNNYVYDNGNTQGQQWFEIKTNKIKIENSDVPF
jgi:hypothetical protein